MLENVVSVLKFKIYCLASSHHMYMNINRTKSGFAGKSYLQIDCSQEGKENKGVKCKKCTHEHNKTYDLIALGKF